MVMNVSDALSAYKQNGGLSSSAGLGAPTAEIGGSDESFGDVLKGFGSDMVSTLKQGEAAAAAGVTGKADVTSVVTALNNAELMLQTVTGIRDKVIAAYQDITKTAI